MAFLQALVLGAALGLLYDVFRIIRIAVPAAKPLVAMQDIIFFAACAVVTFLFLLGNVDGKVRFFLIIGEVLGAILYFCSLSIVLMGFSRLIISFLHGVIKFVLRFIIMPIVHILSQILAITLWPLRFLHNICKKVCQMAKFSLKKNRILLYNHLRALFGGANVFAAIKNRKRGESYLHETED